MAWLVVVACLVPTSLAEARYYDPQTGRFLQEDPEQPGQVRVQGGRVVVIKPSAPSMDPQRLNPYAYVMNNPMNFTDPYGLFEEGTFDYNRTISQCRGFVQPKFEQASQQGTCPPPIPGKSPEESIEDFCKEFARAAQRSETGRTGLGLKKPENSKRVIDEMKKNNPNWPWAEWESSALQLSGSSQ